MKSITRILTLKHETYRNKQGALVLCKSFVRAFLTQDETFHPVWEMVSPQRIKLTLSLTPTESSIPVEFDKAWQHATTTLYGQKRFVYTDLAKLICHLDHTGNLINFHLSIKAL